MEKRRNCSLGAISSLFHNIFCLLLDVLVSVGTRFSLRDKRLFEISEFEITRVNCISDMSFKLSALETLTSSLETLKSLSLFYCII